MCPLSPLFGFCSLNMYNTFFLLLSPFLLQKFSGKAVLWFWIHTSTSWGCNASQAVRFPGLYCSISEFFWSSKWVFKYINCCVSSSLVWSYKWQEEWTFCSCPLLSSYPRLLQTPGFLALSIWIFDAWIFLRRARHKIIWELWFMHHQLIYD